MLEEWYRQIRLRVSFEQWEVLPRLAGYKSEYFDGEAVWTPRPRSYNAVLDLHNLLTSDEQSAAGMVRVRALEMSDWKVLPDLLAGAFRRVPPFCTLDDETRLRAAEDCLRHTRNGGDGEFLPAMSVVAIDDTDKVVGALLVTRWDPEKPHGTGSYETARDSSTDAHIT